MTGGIITVLPITTEEVGGITVVQPSTSMVTMKVMLLPTLRGILVFYIDTTSSDSADSKAVKSVEMILRTRVE